MRIKLGIQSLPNLMEFHRRKIKKSQKELKESFLVFFFGGGGGGRGGEGWRWVDFKRRNPAVQME